MKGYKGFDKGLKCKGFQYEVGKTFKHKGEIKLCDSGFHFCESPLDVFDYYDICESEFAEIEAVGDIKKDTSKSVTNHIKVVKKIALKDFIEAGIDYIRTVCKAGYGATNASSGNYATNASSGDGATNASSGYRAKNASSGYGATNASSGNYATNASSGLGATNASSGNGATNASSGYYAKNASSGNYAKNASSGDYAKNASSGDGATNASSGNGATNASSGDGATNASSGYGATNASSGDYAKNASSGDYAKIVMTGKNNVGAAIGRDSRIKGLKGNWITLAEYDDNGICICVKSSKIDGKKIKENVWYELKKGKFSEVK